jgi:hypothetical protein
MNNMVGVVEEAGTANLSEAPEFTQLYTGHNQSKLVPFVGIFF